MDIYNKPLFIFEMANNHNGNCEHGLKIIREVSEVCNKYRECFNFAFKFQYRDLDTFIHPHYKNRFDIKNVKRFIETRVNEEQFLILKGELKKMGFFTICTAFDEKSVELIKKHEYDVIKIASCSFNDWPLIESIAKINKPVIASTAGSDIEDIDKIVSFFAHRNINLSLMHCVAEYPTKIENLQLNQIDLLKKRYNNVRVGYSTHEAPNNFEGIKVAVAKGVQIFEKHVGVSTETIQLNAYSANPEQIGKWLESAYSVYQMCGVVDKRYVFTNKEKEDLHSLKRGVFAKKKILKGEKVDFTNSYLAFPSSEGQLLASDMSKYNEFYLEDDYLEKDLPVVVNKIKKINNESRIRDIVSKVARILKKGNIIIPLNAKCEISHHFSIDDFENHGATIINCVNRDYCKKIIVVLPGQNHPNHSHKLKEETFNILYGDLRINLDGKEEKYKPGESVVIEKGVNHGFTSDKGCVFEEISTTHYVNDSYYEDNKIKDNLERKTKIFITKELLDNIK